MLLLNCRLKKWQNFAQPCHTGFKPKTRHFRFGSGSGGRPPLPPMMAAPAGAKVVASDFYRGKVKSIYEREPLFRDFAEVRSQSASMEVKALEASFIGQCWLDGRVRGPMVHGYLSGAI